MRALLPLREYLALMASAKASVVATSRLFGSAGRSDGLVSGGRASVAAAVAEKKSMDAEFWWLVAALMALLAVAGGGGGQSVRRGNAIKNG